MTIKGDIHKLDPGAIVELFEIDASPLGGLVYRFHNGVNELGNDVVWQGVTYFRFPIKADGFDVRGSGTLPRPKVQVSNIGGLIGAVLRTSDDLVGMKFTRRRTLVQYLDAVNFVGGVNPTADPAAALPSDVFYVDRKSAETKLTIEWELASITDLAGTEVPRGQFIANLCQSHYRIWNATTGAFDYSDAAECGYTGGLYFDANDNPCAQSQDKCSHRLRGCRLRHGANNPLPFGGFLNCGLTRIS